MKIRPSGVRLAAVVLTILAVACSPAASTSPSASPSGSTGAPTPGQSGDGGSPSAQPPSGDPIVIGSTLSLTGAFGATGVIHQIVGEMFVERLNAAGGLLGRPVEWTVLDDESDQARVTQL